MHDLFSIPVLVLAASSGGDMNQVSEGVVVDDDVNNYFNESDPVIYIPVVINHSPSKNGNTTSPLPNPAPRTPAEMARHNERLNMRRSHDANMRPKSREEDTARKLQQQSRIRSASAGRTSHRPSPPDAVADPVVGDKGSIHPSPAALALLLNDNAKVIASGKRQATSQRQRQQRPPPAPQLQRRSTDISELSMGSGRKRVDPEEVNSQALLRRHPELQGVQLPSVVAPPPTTTKSLKTARTTVSSPRGIEVRCKSVEPPMKSASSSQKKQPESKSTSLVMAVKAPPSASLNNRTSNADVVHSLKSRRQRSKSMNARSNEEPVKSRVYTPPPPRSRAIVTTSTKRVGKVEFSNNNVITKTTTTRPTSSNNLAASSARLARRNAKVPPPPPSSRRKQSSSRTSEKEKEMNGEPIMKSSSQMLFTKTMTTPRRKNSNASSSTSKDHHRIGSHVRNLSNGGTVSTHPLTTGASSSRKGIYNTSIDDIDDDNDDDDDDIQPESVRKVIQHKKRAAKRNSTKEYDDDGSTIIKPMKCIELSSDEKSHASSISACSTSVSSENNDTRVSRRSRSKSRSKKSNREVSVVDGSSNGDTGEDGHGGRRTHSSKMIKDKALSALTGAKDGALHVAALSRSAMDGWGKKGVSGRKWQSALFV